MAFFLLFGVAGAARAQVDNRQALLRDQTIDDLAQVTSINELANTLHRYLIEGGADKFVFGLVDAAKRRIDEGAAAPAGKAAPLVASTSSINLPNIVIGQTSPPQVITLTNSGPTALQFQANYPSVSTYYGFTIASTTCTATLAAGGSCTASITFTPTMNGQVQDSYRVKFVGYYDTRTVTLRGSGSGGTTPPPGSSLPVTLSPPPASGYTYSQLDFGSVAAGQTSASQTVTLTNTGSVALTFSSGYPYIYGPFNISSTTCGATLGAGASCAVNVTYLAPTEAVGPGSSVSSYGYLYLYFVGYTDYKYVYLTGTATGITSIILPMVTPTSNFQFGTVNVGQTLTKTVTLTNTNPFTIQSGIPRIGGSAPFSIAATTCSASMAAGATCTVSTSFAPTLIGSASDALWYYSTSSGSWGYVLSGTGAGTPLSLQMTPALGLGFETPPYCTLSANPSSISAGASSTLTASCDVAATSYSWSGGTCVGNTTASCTVTPSVSTYYYLTASNAYGSGNTASRYVYVYTVAGVPGAPTGVAATAGNAKATVNFAAPSSSGNSAIIGYTVTSHPAGGIDSNADSTALSHRVSNLANGTSYTFTVTARNTQGTGPASSPSNSVTPVAKTDLTPILMLLLD